MDATRQNSSLQSDAGDPDIIFGVPRIADWLGIRLQQAHHQIRKGLPTFRLGGVICARKSTLKAYFAEQEAAARKPPPPSPTPPAPEPAGRRGR